MSVPQYFQVNRTIRDPIIIQNPDGTFATGLVQANFTVKLSSNGSGHQSTTGIAITEVDATNNPGQYDVVIDGTTGFAATQGTYTLAVTLTALPQFTYEQTYVVNNTGSSLGGAFFTATAGNGRVVSLSTGLPIAGAAVVVSTGSTVLGYLLTNALGLWGPVYFPSTGTYLVTVQIAGYVTLTATITVAGTTATLTPASDLSLTTSAIVIMSAAEMWAYFTRQARDVSGTKSVTERTQGVQDAIDMVMKAHKWSWLLRRAYLQINGYLTMTVQLTNNSSAIGFVTSTSVLGVTINTGGTGYTGPVFNVTFTGGGGVGAQGTANVVGGAVVSVTMVTGGSGYTSAPTPVFTAGGGSNASGTSVLLTQFPTWTANGRFLIESQVLDCASLTNGTNAVLVVPYAGQTKQVAAILLQDQYELPDNMLWFHKLIPFQRWGWGGEPTSPEDFYQMQSAVIYQQRFPGKWTIHNGNLMMYPYPQTTDTLCYTYYIRPSPLVNSSDLLDWDPSQLEVIRRAIDVQVCVRYGTYAGGTKVEAEAAYEKALMLAKESSRETTSLPGAMSDMDPWGQRLYRTDWHRRQGL
jgi:hypothetical protein